MPEHDPADRMRELIDRLKAISSEIAAEQTAESDVQRLTREAADLTAEVVKLADARAAELERVDD